MKYTNMIIATACVVALTTITSGCVSSGNKALMKESSQSVASKIVRGKTTKSQVRSMFGDPISVNFTDNGNEVWRYQYSKTQQKLTSYLPVVSAFASGTDTKSKHLVIFFNQRGVVKNYTMSESKIDTNTSLIQ